MSVSQIATTLMHESSLNLLAKFVAPNAEESNAVTQKFNAFVLCMCRNSPFFIHSEWFGKLSILN